MACASTGPPSPTDVPTDVDAIAGSPEHAALFALPRQPAVYPTASGLVRVVDWTMPPQPLVPLYLRRPDAKPQIVAPIGGQERGDHARRAGDDRGTKRVPS